MYFNMFRKYDFDNLYIGIVTVYQNKNKKPWYIMLDVPLMVKNISYVTILSNFLKHRRFLTNYR